MTISIPDRVRAHEYPHVRSIDTQTLDALLRIEELLVQLLIKGDPVIPTEKERSEYELRNPPTKRKNSRQL